MNTRKTIEIAKDLQGRFPEITVADALKIAAQIRAQDILCAALMVSESDYPVALEAIAIALGYSNQRGGFVM